MVEQEGISNKVTLHQKRLTILTANDIKSEIKLFSGDLKLLVGLLFKGITQMDLNKLLYREEIKIFEFGVKKCKVLHIEF